MGQDWTRLSELVEAEREAYNAYLDKRQVGKRRAWHTALGERYAELKRIGQETGETGSAVLRRFYAETVKPRKGRR